MGFSTHSSKAIAIVDARFVKPFDTELIDGCNGRYRLIVTIEENVRFGGFGLSILNYVNEKGMDTPVYNVSLPDCFIEHGSPDSLKRKYGLDVDEVVNGIVKRLGL